MMHYTIVEHHLDTLGEVWKEMQLIHPDEVLTKELKDVIEYADTHEHWVSAGKGGPFIDMHEQAPGESQPSTSEGEDELP